MFSQKWRDKLIKASTGSLRGTDYNALPRDVKVNAERKARKVLFEIAEAEPDKFTPAMLQELYLEMAKHKAKVLKSEHAKRQAKVLARKEKGE
jgi:hypothetical protein